MTAIIQRLGEILDAVDLEFEAALSSGLGMRDGFGDIITDHVRARDDYFAAIREPLIKKYHAFMADSSHLDRMSIHKRYYLPWEAAKNRRNLLEKAGSDFSTERERLDAAAAEDFADLMLTIAWQKNERALFEQYTARSSGTPIKRPRRRRTVRIDGERVKLEMA